MKKQLLLTLSVLLISIGVQAQNYFNEDFNYTASQPLTSNNWTIIGTTTTNPISVTSSGLTYTGFTNSGVGNAAALTTSGQDVYRDINGSLSSGDVYLSFMLNVSAAQATGDYFLAMLPSGSTSSFFSRFFAKSSGTGYVLGVSKWTDAATYGTTVLDFNTTYFVVIKYTFSSTSTTDDQASVFVFSSGIPTTEPTTTYAGPTASVAADQANLSRLALRQGNASNAATLVIDGMRVSTTWGTIALPVQLKSFSTVKSGESTTIKWTTTSEKNNKGFEVQRSVNGSKFVAIGFVKGAGNSNVANSYSFVDTDKNVGSVCYRLKQIDFDGKSTYSKNACVTVETEKATNTAVVTPNPFRGSLTVNYSSQETSSVTIQLIDLLGKVHVQTTELVQGGENLVNINTESLPEGVYFARIDNGTTVQTLRVIKK
jgi:hypothetical protein